MKKKIRVACILDEFSYQCFNPEFIMIELVPGGWKKQMDSFQAQLLFVESVWLGKNELWRGKFRTADSEFIDIVKYCRQQRIPIVFWNKEDPISYASFQCIAKQADYVFTSAAELIPSYKKLLNHDNVYHLHFAAQPSLHNPIEKYDRKDRFCFAGRYYRDFKERCQYFEMISKLCSEEKGFDIFNRFYTVKNPSLGFPEEYKNYVIGGLNYKNIDHAYRAYRYGINMNTVYSSDTMFARRVFELMASNTVVVGNASKGLGLYFGELTINSNEPEKIQQKLKKYCGADEVYRKYRLAGLRKVYEQHLYEDRADFITNKVLGIGLKQPLPRIYIIAVVKNQKQMVHIIESFKRQTYQNIVLYLVTNNSYETTIEHGRVITTTEAKNIKVKYLGKEDYIAVFYAEDYYGDNYLKDLVLQLRHGKYDIVTKNAYYENKRNQIIKKEGTTYQFVENATSRCSICKIAMLGDQTVAEVISQPIWEQGKIFAADEFNYCRAYEERYCDEVDDLKMRDTGISINEINERYNKVD